MKVLTPKQNALEGSTGQERTPEFAVSGLVQGDLSSISTLWEAKPSASGQATIMGEQGSRPW